MKYCWNFCFAKSKQRSLHPNASHSRIFTVSIASHCILTCVSDKNRRRFEDEPWTWLVAAVRLAKTMSFDSHKVSDATSSNDDRHSVKTFDKQIYAIDYSEKNNKLPVFAFETDKFGRRRFMVCSIVHFWSFSILYK